MRKKGNEWKSAAAFLPQPLVREEVVDGAGEGT